MGEAVKNISADFKRKHKNVDWASIARMRDKLIHHYFGVNWEIVWDVAEHKLPKVAEELKPLLSKKQHGS
ncbi:MAG: HepT-like ribonuclease domain-containing protein [Acidobacteriota bacterium]